MHIFYKSVIKRVVRALTILWSTFLFQLSFHTHIIYMCLKRLRLLIFRYFLLPSCFWILLLGLVPQRSCEVKGQIMITHLSKVKQIIRLTFLMDLIKRMVFFPIRGGGDSWRWLCRKTNAEATREGQPACLRTTGVVADNPLPPQPADF